MKGSHTTTCNLLVNNKQPDRFYFDMSVYEIKDQPLDDAQLERSDLIWRGLYLAELKTPEDPPVNPYMNLWN